MKKFFTCESCTFAYKDIVYIEIQSQKQSFPSGTISSSGTGIASSPSTYVYIGNQLIQNKYAVHLACGTVLTINDDEYFELTKELQKLEDVFTLSEVGKIDDSLLEEDRFISKEGIT